jgi:hypothetical protein
MGWFTSKESEDSEGTTRVRENTDDNRVTIDRYVDTSDGRHEHNSYTVDRDTGREEEHRGGENSTDRSYNK